jgi:hypothetical protein
MNHFTVIRAVTKDTANPIITSLSSPKLNVCTALNRSASAAAARIGTAARKENSAAALRFNPINIPPIIADAERDIPGQRARH